MNCARYVTCTSLPKLLVCCFYIQESCLKSCAFVFVSHENTTSMLWDMARSRTRHHALINRSENPPYPHMQQLKRLFPFPPNNRAIGCSPLPLFAAQITDATDEEKSSDDEAPEEVSAAAATALAGRRRKAEQQARQAAGAPKRKRSRASSKADSSGGKDDAAEEGGTGAGHEGLELPSDLLLRVKSGGLQRMEADVLEAKESEEQAAAVAASSASGARRGSRIKAEDIPRT